MEPTLEQKEQWGWHIPELAPVIQHTEYIPVVVPSRLLWFILGLIAGFVLHWL